MNASAFEKWLVTQSWSVRKVCLLGLAMDQIAPSEHVWVRETMELVRSYLEGDIPKVTLEKHMGVGGNLSIHGLDGPHTMRSWAEYWLAESLLIAAIRHPVWIMAYEPYQKDLDIPALSWNFSLIMTPAIAMTTVSNFTGQCYRFNEEMNYQAALELCLEICPRANSVMESWQTTDVLGLARTIYEEESFQELPILADALDDAGCDDGDILEHFRSRPEHGHFRGCWALDLILNKE